MDQMLSKAEFRWVFGIVMTLLVIVLGVISKTAASTDRVAAVEHRLDRTEALLDRIDANVLRLLTERTK